MASDYEFLVRKKGLTAVVSLFGTFGYAAKDIAWPSLETQDVATREWPGEDGEDAFVPEVLRFKAYDLEVPLVYTSGRGECNAAYLKLLKYLTGRSGGVAELDVYDPHNRIGRTGVYLKSLKPDKFHRDGSGDYMSLTATFRVTDPMTDVTLILN